MKRTTPRRMATPDPYTHQRGPLPYWKYKSMIAAELHRLAEPVTHIDPATIDINDLIRRAHGH